MDVTIEVLKPQHGNLYHNHSNQLRRAIGRYSVVHVDHRSGTVRDSQGRCWDWWETAEMADDHFRRIKIIPAE